MDLLEIRTWMLNIQREIKMLPPNAECVLNLDDARLLCLQGKLNHLADLERAEQTRLEELKFQPAMVTVSQEEIEI
jgi:hypothetical protein